MHNANINAHRRTLTVWYIYIDTLVVYDYHSLEVYHNVAVNLCPVLRRGVQRVRHSALFGSVLLSGLKGRRSMWSRWTWMQKWDSALSL